MITVICDPEEKDDILELMESLQRSPDDVRFITRKDRDLVCSGDAMIFSDEEFEDARIGTTTEGRVVYDYDKMVEALMESQDWDQGETEDYIQYNTIRALDYIVDGPIVVYVDDPDDVE